MKTIPKKTIGWEKTCKCVDAEVVPCTVFDPFTGSGTTAIVAMNHGRNFIGTELNPEYIKIAEARIADEIPTTLQEFIV
jgi:methylase of polypeptide subunit release factors